MRPSRQKFSLKKAERVGPPRLPQAEVSPIDNPNIVWNSSYLITINTNKSVRSDFENEQFYDRYGGQVIDALNLVFDADHWERQGLGGLWEAMFREGGRGRLTTRTNNALPPFKGELKEVRLKLFPEVGGKQHRVHFHGIISIDHTLALRLDYAILRDLLKRAYEEMFPRSDHNVPNLYVNIKFIHTTDVTHMYVTKGQSTQAISEMENLSQERIHALEHENGLF